MSSLSLNAYKALVRGAKAPVSVSYPERPSGAIIWGIAHDDAHARALLYLSERLRMLHGPCTLVLSYEGKAPRIGKHKHTICVPLPTDTHEASRRFLEHWRPTVGLWLGGNLNPVLIAEACAKSIPLSLLNAHTDFLEQSVWRWLPSLARETLGCFETITAQDEATQRLLRKMDAGRRDIPVNGTLQDATLAPAVNESVFEEVSTALNGRPVWLATQIQEDELKDVLAAHRTSIKMNHRLALVLVAASFPISVEARRLLKFQGWRVCFWEDGDPIGDETQIIFVEEPEEMGLWFRIAPFCFLGSSLHAGHDACNPYVAASLGSAIIHGPNISPYVSHFSRLAAAGAARPVKDADSLAHGISQMLASDLVAKMAHAAWETISEGAEATDAVIENIQSHLDLQESLA